jgi:hypothetical protein
VSDQADSSLVAWTNRLLLCTLSPIEDKVAGATSDVLLLPSVAEIAGPLNPITGVLSPPLDLSVLSLVGEDRYDCSRCSTLSFNKANEVKPRWTFHDHTYCIHNAAGELCPVKLLPRCETCLYEVRPFYTSPSHRHINPVYRTWLVYTLSPKPNKFSLTN